MLKQKQTDISNRILIIDKQYASSPSPDLYKERLKLQTKFNLLTSHLVESWLIKSRGNFYEHGEKSGRLLVYQLRGLRAKQVIPGIRTENGSLSTDQKLIENFKAFYSSLYRSNCASDRCTMENFLNNRNIPSLTNEMETKLEAPITQGGSTAAISSMQSGKSLGPDGLSVDFYKKFSAELISPICSVFSESFDSGSLPPTLNQACIYLLLKKDKDPFECSSHRPISPLNTDIKVLAKILARRLEHVLPSIISPELGS